MPITYSNPNLLRAAIHVETNTGYLSTGFYPQIANLLQTGNIGDEALFKNHVVRDYYRRLYNHDLGGYIATDYDVGFRPDSFNGIFGFSTALDGLTRYFDKK